MTARSICISEEHLKKKLLPLAIINSDFTEMDFLFISVTRDPSYICLILIFLCMQVFGRMTAFLLTNLPSVFFIGDNILLQMGCG